MISCYEQQVGAGAAGRQACRARHAGPQRQNVLVLVLHSPCACRGALPPESPALGAWRNTAPLLVLGSHAWNAPNKAGRLACGPEDGALAEICRVAKPGAFILLSVPLHAARWTPFDDFVGHRRRYEPGDLATQLGKHRLAVERSAIFGMQPKSSRLLNLGMWWLTHQRERAMWWYNRAFMPMGLRFQKKLDFLPGMIETNDVDEILMVCRKRA